MSSISTVSGNSNIPELGMNKKGDEAQKKLQELSAKIKVSIFGAETRKEIRAEAKTCNDLSSNLSFLKKEESSSSCENVMSRLQDLQAMAVSAGGSAGELLGQDGITDSIKESIKQTITETLKFAEDTIQRTTTNAEEAIAQVTSQESSSAASSSKPATKETNTFAPTAAPLKEGITEVVADKAVVAEGKQDNIFASKVPVATI